MVIGASSPSRSLSVEMPGPVTRASFSGSASRASSTETWMRPTVEAAVEEHGEDRENLRPIG
jgi:hypothetical protein